MLIQIRGTSGSGKTWIIKKLMSEYEFNPIKKNGVVMGYYCEELNTFLVGKYETACGGCDSIKTQDETCSRIRKALNKGWNVIFEGLICSHISKRYAELYEELTEKGEKVEYIFLNTSLEKCRDNINKRRAQAGKPPTTAKNTEKDYTSTRKSRKNMNSMGVPNKAMPILSSDKALAHILELLEEN